MICAQCGNDVAEGSPVCPRCGAQMVQMAAGQAAGMDVFLFEPIRHTNPFCAGMRPVLGIRPELTAGLRHALGRRARGLVSADGARMPVRVDR